MSLFDALSKISEQIKSQLHLMNETEDATILASIHPFIRALGYSTENLNEVKPQYPIMDWDAADFAILRDGKPIILLEFKKADVKLSHKWWKQLSGYFNAEDVHFGILTNGLEFKFYSDLVKSNVMDAEPFLVIDMLNLDASAVKALEDFAKTRFEPGACWRYWKVRAALEKEMRAPSNELVRVFAKQAHDGTLWPEVIDMYRPVVKRAWQDILEQGLSQSIAEPDTEPPPDPPPPDVVEVPIYAVHQERRFEATLLVDEVMNWNKKVILIRFDGELLPHVEAMKRAIHKVSQDARSFPAALRFWRFTHPATGEELPIKAISDDVKNGGSLRQLFVNRLKS